MAEGPSETLDVYAKELAEAIAELKKQTASFDAVRTACQTLHDFELDHNNVKTGLPDIIIRPKGHATEDCVIVDLDQIGPFAALSTKPFFEMVAGKVGTLLQQAWGRINQINSNAQQVIQLVNAKREQEERGPIRR